MYFIGGFTFKFSFQMLLLSVSAIYVLILVINFYKNQSLEAQSLYKDYKFLIENIQEIIIKTDLNLTVNYINKPFLGKKDEYLGQRSSKFEFLDTNLLNEILFKEGDYNWTWKNKEDNRSYRFRANLIHGDPCILIVCRDVTDDAVKNHILLETIKKESFYKGKMEFISSLSHEIKNPLQALNYSCETLLTSKTINTETINEIISSKDNLSRVLGNIMEFTKYQMGAVSVVQANLNPIEEIISAIEINKVEAKKKGLDIGFSFDTDFPSTIMSDKGKIVDAVNYVLSNSIKFTNQGKIEVKCTINDKNDMKFMKIIIRDQGIGISKELLKELFNPFSKIERKNLCGMGLSITKKIVDLLQGSIEIQSELGRGTTLTIELPLFGASNENFKILELKEKDITVNKVLIVEDNVIIHKNLKHILQKNGIDYIKSAFNGLEGVEQAKKEFFDIIIMDIKMPIMDGIEAISEIRKIQENSKKSSIICCTGNLLIDDDCKADVVLSKPISKDVILKTIERFS